MTQPINKTGYTIYSEYEKVRYIDIKYFDKYIVLNYKENMWNILTQTDYVDLTDKKVVDIEHYIAFKTYLL